LNLDSLDTVEVLVAIEEEFNIEIPEYVISFGTNYFNYLYMLTVFFFSNNADEIKSIDQAVEYILAQPEGK